MTDGGVASRVAGESGELAELFRHVFGPGCRITDHQVVIDRSDYAVVLATLTDPELAVAVKLAGPAAPLPCPFDRTAAILRLVRAQTPVPVSEALAWDTSYRGWPW